MQCHWIPKGRRCQTSQRTATCGTQTPTTTLQVAEGDTSTTTVGLNDRPDLRRLVICISPLHSRPAQAAACSINGRGRLTSQSGHPRETAPRMACFSQRLCSIRFLSRMSGGEANIRKGMERTRLRSHRVARTKDASPVDPLITAAEGTATWASPRSSY